MRPQDEGNLNFGMLSAIVDRIRGMLQRVAPPQRTSLCRDFDETLGRLEHSVAKLRRYIDANKTDG
jgi:hypothetical protein